MTDTNDLLATRWARAAERAPGLVVRLWLIRGALAIVAIAGTLHLANLTLWGWRSGQAGLITLIAAHVLAIAMAVGFPVRHDGHEGHDALASSPVPFTRILRGYGDRAERLRALGMVVLLELGLRFLAPPIMALVAGHQVRWPAEFVVAGAACLVVWPLQRIAASQRLEASRLSALEP
jgi:hypothetical protein